MKSTVIALIWVLFSVQSVTQTLTWQDLTTSPGYERILRGSEGRLFATNWRGVVYVSSDEGASWSGILAFPASSPVQQFVARDGRVTVQIYDNNPQVVSKIQIYNWNGSPHSWTRIYQSSSTPYVNLMLDASGTVYAINRQASFATFTSTNGRILRFRQGGWSPIGDVQGFLGLDFRRPSNPPLATAVTDSGHLYIAPDDGGLYFSRDTAKSFRKTLNVYSITAVSVLSGSRILAGAVPATVRIGSDSVRTNGGVFQSTDGGFNWRSLGLEGVRISSIAESGSGTLFAIVDGNIYRYFTSIADWRLVLRAGSALTTVSFTNSNIVMASSESDGIFRSADDGITWAGSQLRGNDVFTMLADDNGDIYAGTLGNGVFKRGVDGLGWTPLSPDTSALYVFALLKSSGYLYSGTDDGLFRSSDEGRSWEGLDGSGVNGPVYTMVAADNGNLFAGSNFGVSRSTNAGTSWHSAGLASLKVLSMGISRQNILYVATERNGIYFSTNEGQSWANRGLARADLQTVQVDRQGRVFVGVYGGVFRSTNRGSTWEFRSVGTAGYIYTMAFGDSQTVYAGSYNGVHVSRNLGDTWQSAGDSGLTRNFVLALTPTPDGNLLAGSYRGGVYRSRQQISPRFVLAVSDFANIPRKTSLEQNYPNPFNPSTSFKIHTTEIGRVTIRVFDLLGREVAVLLDERRPAGESLVVWDADDQPSGVYFYQMVFQPDRAEVGTYYSSLRKMVLLR